MTEACLLHGGTLLSGERGFEPYQADIFVHRGRIKTIGPYDKSLEEDFRALRVIDCSGRLVLPGFVQAHIHLAQTLFRGLAEGMTLLDWLSSRILPLEAAHDPDTLYASARLGIAELLLSGCTTLLDMGSVHHTESIFEAASQMGIRMVSGKIMMDHGDMMPESLKQDADHALNLSIDLLDKYHDSCGGRLRYAFAPRFLLSCSDALMRETLGLARERDVLWHTHVAEQLSEVEWLRKKTGRLSLELIDEWGGADTRLALAHMVHLADKEWDIMKGWKAPGILHCPRANTRLGSGSCRVVDFLTRRMAIGLGSDGSACNNRLDMFEEMRSAAALQDLKLGPGALSSSDLLSMATIGGARALGLEEEIGTLEIGKRADLIVIDPDGVSMVSGAHPADALVHNGNPGVVGLVMVDGEIRAEGGKLVRVDGSELAKEAKDAIHILTSRAFD